MNFELGTRNRRHRSSACNHDGGSIGAPWRRYRIRYKIWAIGNFSCPKHLLRQRSGAQRPRNGKTIASRAGAVLCCCAVELQYWHSRSNNEHRCPADRLSKSLPHVDLKKKAIRPMIISIHEPLALANGDIIVAGARPDFRDGGRVGGHQTGGHRAGHELLFWGDDMHAATQGACILMPVQRC